MRSESYGIEDRSDVNLASSPIAKWALMAGGSALAIYGATRRSKSGLGLMAAGGLIAAQGARTAFGRRDFHAQSSFAVNCSAAGAYNFWRNLDNLRLFMRHLDSIRAIDERRSEWVAIGPLNARVRWTSEIEQDRRDELISWRTAPDSAFQMRSSVQFRPAPGGRGTIVTASIDYELPAGPLAKAVAAIFGKNPEMILRENLRRFKALMEAGEIPITHGQPHGPRSTLVSAIHSAYPEPRKPSGYPQSQPAQAMVAKGGA